MHNVLTRGIRVHHACALMLLMFCSAFANVQADAPLSDIDALTPAEQYRQFNLAVMISAGATPELLDYMQARDPSAEGGTPAGRLRVVDIDDFLTPLNRIVNQDETLTKAARYMRVAQAQDAAIMQRMAEVAATHEEEIAAVNLVQLAEDAIIIRTSLAGSMAYASANAGADSAAGAAIAEQLASFEHETVRLRNQMEYWKFDQELATITRDAMKDTGGRMDAYQRLLEEGPDSDGFEHHLKAIERIYKETRKRTRDKKPDTVNDKLIEEHGRVKN